MVQKLHIYENVYFDQSFGFSKYKQCLYYSFTLYHCAIYNSLNAGCFSIPSGCQKRWIQRRPYILYGSKLFAKVIGRWQKPPPHPPPPHPPAGKDLNTEQLLDNHYFLAKTLTKINFIWLQLFSIWLKCWCHVINFHYHMTSLLGVK